MWYNPQHSMSAAFGLLAMPIAGIRRVNARSPPSHSRSCPGAATTFNPLIGGLFSLIYGAVVIADAIALARSHG
jgi:hypothetical protein